MRIKIPRELEEWRLSEEEGGPLGTDESANYEGVFSIPSAKRAKSITGLEFGHPFDYHATFQVQSSEIAGGVETGVDWEMVTVIVKIERPKGVLEQRKPTFEEAEWLKTVFWEDYETVAVFIGSKASNRATDHRIAHIMRKGDGTMDVPELFREHMPHDETTSSSTGFSVFDVLNERKKRARDRAAEEKAGAYARKRHDIKRIMDTAQIVRAPLRIREDPSTEGQEIAAPRYQFSERDFLKLKKLLDITDD